MKRSRATQILSVLFLVMTLASCTPTGPFESACKKAEAFIPKDSFMIGGDGEKWNPSTGERLGTAKLDDPEFLPTEMQKNILIQFIALNTVGKPDEAYDEYVIPSSDVVNKEDLEKYPVDIKGAKVTAFFGSGDYYMISIKKDHTHWIIFVSDDGIERLSISSGVGTDRIELPNRSSAPNTMASVAPSLGS